MAVRFWNFIRHPKASIKWLLTKQYFLMNCIAILSGFIGAGAAWLLGILISGIRIFFYGVIYDNIPEGWKWTMIIALPTLAAAITAPFLIKWAPEARGHGIPEVMESVIYKEGYIKTTTPYLKLVASGICIGGGLSLGKEGPIAQIGAGFSSLLGRKAGLKGRNIQTIVVCGLVAGLSATFNAPIGGLIFGIEVLLVSMSVHNLIPIIISSVVATVTGRFILETGAHAVIEIPDIFRDINFIEYVPYLHWFIVLGIVCGLVALLYTKSVHYIERWAYNTKVPPFFVLVSGALLTGLVGIISPRENSVIIDFRFGSRILYSQQVENVPSIFGGLDYKLILDAFKAGPLGEFGFTPFFASLGLTLIILILFKILATALSAGTGNSGGVFGPALVLGALSGYWVARMLSLGGLNFSPAMFALFTLTGMASVYTGSSRAVLTMIFMASEMTQSYQSFLPLMITCSISYFMSRILMKDTIDTQKIALKGLSITMGGPTDLLANTHVREIMTKNVICVPETMKMREFAALIESMDHVAYPVIGSQGDFLGLVTNFNLKQAQIEEKLDTTVLEQSVKNAPIIYPDEVVEQALSKIFCSEIDRLVVLESPERKQVVGIVSHSDILRCIEIQKLKDVELRTQLEEEVIKTELQRVEKLTKSSPDVYEQVKVISKGKELREQNLLEYLKEASMKSQNLVNKQDLKKYQINLFQKRKRKGSEETV